MKLTLKRFAVMLLPVVLVIIGLFLVINSCQIFTPGLDIVIRNGQIIDGTGNPWYRADLGIKDGKIAEIGNLEARQSKRIIDAEGMVVVPGFIDMHTHAERKILEIPAVENYIRQGVTTVVGGNCGGSPFPIGEFLKKVAANSISLNLALLVGHNTIRKEVMGTENREPTFEELEKMKKLVERSMQDGAVGLSTGLKYIPGAYAKTDEVIALSEVVASFGGFYATHMRAEGLGLIEAVQEAIEIGRKAKIPIQISHHKAMGKNMWNSSIKTLQLVDEAVGAGIDITLDQYPYTATSTGLTVVFPTWALEGGKKKINKRLEEPKLREKIKEGIIHNILYDRGGGDPASIVVASYPPDSTLEGKNIAEITFIRGREPTAANAAETIMDLQHAGGGKGIYHCLGEEDIERIMKHPRVMHASDGATIKFGKAKPHPRSYGTFPRVLGNYVREKKVISLEDAIRKMTSLPAQRLKLQDRGILKEKMWADVVVFDPQTVSDQATWAQPHQYPAGIPYVVVNGKLVIDEGKWTKVFPGKVLYGPGKN
ncbi:MAG: amidohydrolase family protein [bacterium]